VGFQDLHPCWAQAQEFGDANSRHRTRRSHGLVGQLLCPKPLLLQLVLYLTDQVLLLMLLLMLLLLLMMMMIMVPLLLLLCLLLLMMLLS